MNHLIGSSWELNCHRTVVAAGLFVLSVSAVQAQQEIVLLQTRAGIAVADRLDLVASLGGAEVDRIDALDVSMVQMPTVGAASLTASTSESVYIESIESIPTAAATALPSDPLFSSQWALTQIGAPNVWSTTSGARTVVAVVDSGIDLGHPDLLGSVAGFDFVNNDADPSDDYGHGTAMAGVIAARANGVGTVGTAPQATLLPIKVLGANGVGLYSAIAQGIVYAADHGARVINLSLAGRNPSDILQSSVDYAAARGALVVASAGNAGSGAPNYPAACRNVIAVTASDNADAIAAFSNYGAWVGLSAPGVNILTTGLRSHGTDFTTTSGTSPAAAYVSGALALLLGAPGSSSTLAFDSLSHSAVDVLTSGWDPYSGSGRIDVASALLRIVPPVVDRTRPQVSISYPTTYMTVAGVVSIRLVATDNVGVARVELSLNGRVIGRVSDAPFVVDWDSGTAASGTHLLTARAYDQAGNVRASKPVAVRVGIPSPPLSPTTVRVAPSSGDRARPTAAISSPTKSASVRGVVGVDVTASDNVGVDHVELRVDKIPVAIDSATPFSFAWDSGSVSAGRHSLSVTAYDATGNNRLSKAILVNVAR